MISSTDFAEFAQAVYANRIILGVDPAFARKVYTNLSLSRFAQATGEAPYFEKLVIWFLLMTSALAMLASTAIAVALFRWWSIPLIVVAFLIWLWNKGAASVGGARLTIPSLLLALAVGSYVYRLFSPDLYSILLVAYAYAVWSDRLVYAAACNLFRASVTRNAKAYRALRSGVVVAPAPRGSWSSHLQRYLEFCDSRYDDIPIAARMAREEVACEICAAGLSASDEPLSGLSRDEILATVRLCLPLLPAGRPDAGVITDRLLEYLTYGVAL
jgi:hypothetical protein